MALVLGIVSPASTSAQSAPAPPCIGVDLPADHWGVEAVRRLDAAGVVPVQVASAIVDVCQLNALLESAESVAPPRLVRTIRGWRGLLAAEYAMDGEGARPVAARVAATVGHDEDVTRPGRGEFAPDRTGALPVDDGATATLSAGGAAVAEDRFWGATSLEVGDDGFDVERLEVAARVGAVELTLGRGEAAYGFTRGGAVVLSRVGGLDRLQIETLNPFRLPGVLAAGGSFTFTTLFAKLGPPRHLDDPYFWAAKGTWRPHERLTFGVTRAAMFGGDGVEITGRRLFDLLIGDVTGIGFENQVVSTEGILRLPTEAVVPATIYLEWGAEDAAGAWWDVPARIFGVYLPTLPGAQSTSLTFEYASFAESCCGNPEWYRHWSFTGSWAIEEAPLGHPLGGHGSEALMRLDAHTGGAARRFVADLFVRDRKAENLYVPGRGGRSVGTRLRADWRVARPLELAAAAVIEDGDGWTERSLRIAGKIFLLP